MGSGNVKSARNTDCGPSDVPEIPHDTCSARFFNGDRVQILGLQDRTDLNGSFGLCKGAAEDPMRLEIQLESGDRRTLALKPANLALASGFGAGDRVRISGLQARPELNGQEGVCQGPATSDSSRLTVCLDSGSSISVKVSNLEQGAIGRGATPQALAPPSGPAAAPNCSGCGRRIGFHVNAKGFPVDVCCRSCAESTGSHDDMCFARKAVPSASPAAADIPPSSSSSSAPPPPKPPAQWKTLEEDTAAVAAAKALCRALALGRTDGGQASRKDLDLAARILEDRLGAWPNRLRHFDLRAAPLVQVEAIGAKGCLWLQHLELYRTWLGATLFVEVIAAQEAALQAFWKQRGARILDRGLKAGDSLQLHALSVVEEVWGSIVDRQHSQEYCDRGTNKIIHCGTLTEYTPPSCGAIRSNYWTQLGVPESRTEAAVERIVRVGLVNKKACFDEAHVPLYHGIAANAFGQWASSGPRFKAYSGKFGDGVYLTPSFQMACMYAFRTPRTLAGIAEKNLASARFGHTKDGRWNYLVCLQAMVTAKAISKFAGTAFTDAGDGWDLEGQISVVRDPSEAQIYGVLFCYFPRSFKF